MRKLVAIGEALIDFAPETIGAPIKEVEAFAPKVGGAPANVCGAYVKLGGEAVMLTQLGNDPFGDKIVEELLAEGIDVSYIIRTDQANTSLAFVALKENGDREFSFYRKPGADMLYQPKDVKESVFQDAYALHFCSVSLGNYPMKEAHVQAIQYAKKANAIISFDPNLRKQLWESEEDLKKAVLEFLPQVDILKLSDEEVEFVTGKENLEDALEALFDLGITVVILTLGGDGAMVYTKQTKAKQPGVEVSPVDTTGAGDGFIGSLLYQLAESEKSLEDMSTMPEEEWESYLRFSNIFCGESVQKQGAIASYPTMQEMQQLCRR